MPYDQTSRDLGRAPVEARRRRVVGETAGADDAHTHVMVAQEFSHCLPECAHAAEGRPRIGRAIHEDRQDIIARQGAGKLEQRNGDTVIHLHLMGNRHVEIAGLQETDAIERELARHPQRAAFEVPILAAFG
jgi:hypothetical protein